MPCPRSGSISMQGWKRGSSPNSTNCKKKGYPMKKLLVLLCVFTLVAGITMSAQAALVTITFDEAWVTSGLTNDRYDGTQVDTQYSFMGVTWVDTVADDPDVLTGQGITHAGEFSGSWSDSDNMLWNYGQGGGGTTPVNAPILLSVPADFFSFEFRRPNAGGSVDVQLYMSDTLVYEGNVSWTYGQDWQTFSYSGNLFDKVVLVSGDKFNSDNYTFNMVPIPASLWLLAGGLGLLPLHRRMQKQANA